MECLNVEQHLKEAKPGFRFSLLIPYGQTYTFRECSREAPGHKGFHVVCAHLIAYFVPGCVLGILGFLYCWGGVVLPEVTITYHSLVTFF